MRQSQLFYQTLREAPKDEKSINAQLLIRAGFIYKEMAGVYSFLPLGLRVLKKIEKIVREEINKISGQEMLMTVLQPKGIWEETGRWSKEIGEVMYKLKGEELGLGPTHEEMISDIVRKLVESWQDLPFYLYQIQTKFRKEPRARSGLLRGREFEMKDLYSFHSSQKDFQKYYQVVKKTYFKILRRCGLESILTEASGKGFTKGFTHEFQVLAKEGEDKIVYCPRKHFSQNKEIAKYRAGQKCPICKKTLREGKSIEVGNIFPLGTKYSESMNLYFVDKKGERRPVIMGCYGLGISRVMGAVVEVHYDQLGMIWPKEIAPFQIHLIPILAKRKSLVQNKTEKLYQTLQSAGFEVLYEDRKKKSTGEKLMEADLIGIPQRIVISPKTLEKNSVEIKERGKKKFKLVKIKSLSQFLNESI